MIKLTTQIYKTDHNKLGPSEQETSSGTNKQTNTHTHTHTHSHTHTHTHTRTHTHTHTIPQCRYCTKINQTLLRHEKPVETDGLRTTKCYGYNNYL